MRMIFVIPEKKNREDKTLIALRTVFKWSAKIPEKKLLIWHGSYRSFQFDSFSNQKYPQTLQRVTQFGLFCPKRNKKKKTCQAQQIRLLERIYCSGNFDGCSIGVGCLLHWQVRNDKSVIIVYVCRRLGEFIYLFFFFKGVDQIVNNIWKPGSRPELI